MADSNTGEEKNVDMSKLLDGMNALAEGMKAMQQTMSQIPQSIQDGMASTLQQSRQNNNDDDEDEDEDSFLNSSLEDMSRTDLAKFIVAESVKALKGEMKSIQQKVGSVEENVNKSNLATQLRELTTKNPDVVEWVEEMKAIAKETPGISMARALALAKSENPDKVKELTEKYQEKGSDEGKNQSSEGKRKFGGMTPTSGQNDQKSDMSKKDAAEAAWDQVMDEISPKEEELSAAG